MEPGPAPTHTAPPPGTRAGSHALDTIVTIERGLGPAGRIAVVSFDRGNRINALSPETMRQLRRAAESFEDDTATSVVILRGRLDGFTAGFDLKDVEGRGQGALGLADRRAALRIGPKMCAAWHALTQVTIAAIEGHCIGGGVALVVSLDFRICGVGAHFRVPEVALGMNMSWGSLPRIVSLIGPARAKQAVLFANDQIAASDALQWGLVEHVVPDGTAFDQAMEQASQLAALPPIPVAMTKATINQIASAHDSLGAHMDLDQYALTNTSADFREGVAAFMEGRAPTFEGR